MNIKNKRYMTFTWIPFYKEFAQKLLQFKNNRTLLIEWIYGNINRALIKHFKDAPDGRRVLDTDPFTVMAIINRGISFDKKVELCRKFKSFLNISAPVPQDFSGVPEMNNMLSNFMAFEANRKDGDIEKLWNLFECAVRDKSIEDAYEALNGQYLIKYNVTMGLFWIRPDKYLALDGNNKAKLIALGIASFDGKFVPYKDYMGIMKRLDEKMKAGEIGCTNYAEFSYTAYKQSEGVVKQVASNSNLDASYVDKPNRAYWISGYTFGKPGSQFNRFISENLWECMYKDDNASNHRLLLLAKSISKGDIIILKSTSTRGKNHDKPFMRIKAVGLVESDIAVTETKEMTKCQCTVKYINTEEKDFNGEIYGSYRKTLHKADSELNEIIDYVNNILSDNRITTPDTTQKQTLKTNKRYQKYVDLLNEVHNLVLTGAPGTGKTYLAQKIAEEMGAETMFVQFHPSYDYTDFVEGLRPVERSDGQMGFERRDGVFKNFCKKAYKNIEDSRKTIQELEEEKSLEEKYNEVLDKIENGEINDFKLKTDGKKMEVVKISDFNNIILRTPSTTTERTYTVSFDRIAKLAKVYPDLNSLNAISNINDAIRNAIGGCNASSYWAVLHEVYKQGRTIKRNVQSEIKRKPFVCIIDEINRGEASKIFGELFYAIDPGYRGKKENLVQTQYQNLIPETDVFAKGFYVPENVYILATMNDIDRSVESMDFAMRRRFTWKEITPNDTKAMLDKLYCANEAIATMVRLNTVIAETEGLGAAYQIGPAYYLKLNENGGDFKKLWEMNIEPLLKEYLRGFRKANEMLYKFRTAYFGTKEELVDNKTELIDED